MIQTSDGGYALLGFAMAVSLGAAGALLIKADSHGNEQWMQPYFSQEANSNMASANSIVQTADGGYEIAGDNEGGSNLDNTGTYLVKTDSQGNVLWRQSYMVGADVTSLVKTGDGGYVMAGSSFHGGFWSAKVNSTGALQWSHTYEGNDYCMAMVQTRDGGYALAGLVVSQNVLSNVLLMKTDSNGNMLWNRTYGDSIQFFSLTQTSDGGYALAGNELANNSTEGGEVLLLKTNSDGKILWNQTYSSLRSEVAYCVIQTSDGGYTLGCSNNFVKTDSNGDLQWDIPCNGNVCSVVQTSDGGYTIDGSALGGSNFLIRTNTPITSTTPSSTSTQSQSIQPENSQTNNYAGYYLVVAAAIAVALLIVIAIATMLRRSNAWLQSRNLHVKDIDEQNDSP
jgi:hypothetical protein